VLQIACRRSPDGSLVSLPAPAFALGHTQFIEAVEQSIITGTVAFVRRWPWNSRLARSRMGAKRPAPLRRGHLCFSRCRKDPTSEPLDYRRLEMLLMAEMRRGGL